MAHRDHVTTWWPEVMGGPAEYTERLGGYERMIAHHRDLAITAEQRLRFVTLLSAAADTARTAGRPRVPGRPDGLRGVGNPPGGGELGPGRDAAAARTGTALGLGVAPPYRP